jgi:chromatin remodeling complex protein RSC6
VVTGKVNFRSSLLNSRQLLSRLRSARIRRISSSKRSKILERNSRKHLASRSSSRSSRKNAENGRRSTMLRRKRRTASRDYSKKRNKSQKISKTELTSGKKNILSSLHNQVKSKLFKTRSAN